MSIDKLKNFNEQIADGFFNAEGIRQVKSFCNTEEAAIILVKKFWTAMGRNKYVSKDSDYLNELTFGDRTIVMHEGDQWKIIFNGNGNPLSKNAFEWLQTKGIVEK